MNADFRVIDPAQVIDVAQKYRFEGYRLMQQCATRVEIDGMAEDGTEGEVKKVPACELIYTFGKGLEVEQVKLTVPDDGEVASISSVFPHAACMTAVSPASLAPLTPRPDFMR